MTEFVYICTPKTLNITYCIMSVKSNLQVARAAYQPKLPKALKGAVKAVEGAATQSVGNQEEIKALFPNTYGMPVVRFADGGSADSQSFNVGIILSGGQAPGGHNVISGLYDGVKAINPANKLYGFSRDITIREVIASYQYPNTLEVLEVGEAELRFALERAAEYFDYSDGRVSISKSFLEPKIENYNYDYYLGLSYTFDLRKPAGQRVTRLLYEGAELGGKRLRLCLNNYRASGTGGYDVFRECRKISSLNLDVQDLAVSFLLSHGGDITWPKADFTCIC